jgi:hypothetical protein
MINAAGEHVDTACRPGLDLVIAHDDYTSRRPDIEITIMSGKPKWLGIRKSFEVSNSVSSFSSRYFGALTDLEQKDGGQRESNTESAQSSKKKINTVLQISRLQSWFTIPN